MLHSRLKEINRWHTLLSFTHTHTSLLTIDTQHRYKLAITAFFSVCFISLLPVPFFSIAFAYLRIGMSFLCYHLDSFQCFFMVFFYINFIFRLQIFIIMCIVIYLIFFFAYDSHSVWRTRKIPEVKLNQKTQKKFTLAKVKVKKINSDHSSSTQWKKVKHIEKNNSNFYLNRIGKPNFGCFLVVQMTSVFFILTMTVWCTHFKSFYNDKKNVYLDEKNMNGTNGCMNKKVI